jgi:hypothetical protein
MTDVKTKALLITVRKVLSVHCWSGECCELRALIDAALAEPSTQWAPDPFWGGRSVEARVNGCYVEIHDVDYDDEFPWQWSISRSEIAESGNAKTKEAAMEAALKFVKELTR